MEDTQNHDGAPEQAAPQQKKDYTKWIIVGVIVLAVLYGAQMFLSPGRMMERNIERAIERETGQDVDIDYGGGRDDNANITVSGTDGGTYTMSAGEDVKVPDTWPTSVPVPSGVKVVNAGTMMGADSDSSVGSTLVFMTSQSMSDVVEYYKRELEANGWTIGGTFATSDGSMLTANRGETESVVVNSGTSEEGTTVSIIVRSE